MSLTGASIVQKYRRSEEKTQRIAGRQAFRRLVFYKNYQGETSAAWLLVIYKDTKCLYWAPTNLDRGNPKAEF
jgi:hypothetical protein